MPFYLSSPYLLPIALLICSNLFMTVAWYGHLRFKEVPLIGVIAASWAIAFIEYCFAVPANRYGNAVYSAAQLKTMQEVITLLVFAGFSLVYLKEPIGWNHLVGFALISAGAFFIFQKWEPPDFGGMEWRIIGWMLRRTRCIGDFSMPR
jgi:uncharacterized protein (DUF486 family)